MDRLNLTSVKDFSPYLTSCQRSQNITSQTISQRRTDPSFHIKTKGRRKNK
jgi:hypothetical protein